MLAGRYPFSISPGLTRIRLGFPRRSWSRFVCFRSRSVGQSSSVANLRPPGANVQFFEHMLRAMIHNSCVKERGQIERPQ